jgi:hypothetical protein
VKEVRYVSILFGGAVLLVGSVASIVSGGGLAAVAVKRFAERLENAKSTKSNERSDARPRNTKRND